LLWTIILVNTLVFILLCLLLSIGPYTKNADFVKSRTQRQDRRVS
jgi:hypothetical protein